MRLEWHEGLQFRTWKMEVSFGLCGAVPTILGKFSELEDRELWLHANSLNVDLPPLPLFIFHFMCCLSWTPKETARGGVKERGAPRNSIAGHVWWPICVANSLAFPPGFWLPPWLGSRLCVCLYMFLIKFITLAHDEHDAIFLRPSPSHSYLFNRKIVTQTQTREFLFLKGAQKGVNFYYASVDFVCLWPIIIT